MHLLTKIFVVLVSLLAVMLVPLVVVYASNEDSFRAKYQRADLERAGAREELNAEKLRYSAETQRLQGEIDKLIAENEQITRDRDDKLADIRRLERDLAMTQSQQAQFQSDVAILAAAHQAAQQMSANLLAEAQAVRSQALDSERRVVDLDERLREVRGQLDVAVAARRAIAEELQQLKEELAAAENKVKVYITTFGEIDEDATFETPIDVDLDATVLNVVRDDQNLAEINVGQVDGVKKGWKMQISREGHFIANLLIIEVDINRSTGVIELEDAARRGVVQPGDRVVARVGQ